MYHAGQLNDVQAQFWKTKPSEELYDLANDPHEINNLAGSAEHAEVLAEMRKAHSDWSARVKDIGLLPEAMIHERANQSGKTPYEVGHDPALFDHAAIFAAANLATSLKAEGLPEIVKLLASEDSAIRYWGAIGLLTQENAGIEAGHAALTKALSDESQIVQVTAAEALGRYGSDDDAAKAFEVLLANAQPDQSAFLAIAAWNAIDYLDDRAKSAADRIAQTDGSPSNPPNRADKYATSLRAKVLADLGVSDPMKKAKKPKKKKN